MSCSLAHLDDIRWDLQIATRRLFNVFNRHAFGDFNQLDDFFCFFFCFCVVRIEEKPIFFSGTYNKFSISNIDDAEVGDDTIDTTLGRKWQRARFE